MSFKDSEVLAERIIAVERHLNRVQERIPKSVQEFISNQDVSDIVILHLWQAIQIVIDIAVSSAVHLKLGTPSTYAEAFQKLAEGGYLEKEHALRLSQACGFRNRIVHAYEGLDMKVVYQAAQSGPKDLALFLTAVKNWQAP